TATVCGRIAGLWRCRPRSRLLNTGAGSAQHCGEKEHRNRRSLDAVDHVAASATSTNARRSFFDINRSGTLHGRLKRNDAPFKPPSDAPSASESSLLGARRAAAKTASKAQPAKTCLIRCNIGFRNSLRHWL